MDFYTIATVEKKSGVLQLRPDWTVGRSGDLMTRNGSFYAIWNEDEKLWSTDIYDVQKLVDADIQQHKEELEEKTGYNYTAARLQANSSKLWDEFQHYIRNSGYNNHNLDEKLTFEDTEVKKTDYASKRLPYSLRKGSHDAWDMIVGTLYNEEERAKIEWAIGAVVSGDSKMIQKFLVFYGPPGSGKSTILNIIELLFQGYTAVFDARELAASNNSFATASFKTNPLVAIQHDGDLSRIYDNTKLNSIVAHEVLSVNEKYKAPFEARSNAFLFMGTNLPVKITNAKAGIIRRLIDVVPTGHTIEHDLYHDLMERVKFELGAIAYHCLEVYKSMGKNYYSNYRPTEMMLQTDIFYNYIEAFFDIFKEQDGVTLKQAWALYKEYCNETGIEKMLPQYRLRDELKNYFEHFEERAKVDGVYVRSYYSGFKSLEKHPPTAEMPSKPEGLYQIELEETVSVFDETYSGRPAQYAKKDGTPRKKWTEVTTTLKDIDTSELHYVQVPENHIVIDFDLTNLDGNKDIDYSLEEASKWPPTYTEVSKSGEGLHLHYLYIGDVNHLASIYAPGIEIKTLLGGSSLRRKLSKCNHMTIAPLDGGLPKKEKPILSNKAIMTERGLRELIEKNLRKEIHPGTKPSIDFIQKILDDAYDADLPYDIRDMRPRILTFALKSTNQSSTCLKTVQKMKFVGKNEMPENTKTEGPLTFFDVEVYPNLLVVCWKYAGNDNVVRMVNPSSKDVEDLFKHKLVGFNNRRYDNHILYARFLGWDNNEIYNLSHKIIYGGNERNVLFGEAYNISYTDIYDFSSKKQGLKRFQIDLGLHHAELDIPWNDPVPENRWDQVVEYCVNDVITTEEVFKSREQDFVARQILAKLSGLSVNHTTQAHTAKIVFGEERNPQKSFVYTDLSKEFPGYRFDGKESTYRGEVTGEGGYVYAEPGLYGDVLVMDVSSMHPTSIGILNLFGPYTSKFEELTEARLAIKRKDYEMTRILLDGRLEEFLRDEQDAEDLAYALKIVINIVYGLTSAKFPNPFQDIRNKDNIVAKRGALFMIELKNEVQAQGARVVHIKTDSIKIPDATADICEFIIKFGKKYGYTFEIENTYEKFCLINDAVYIAQSEDGWTAVGAQFQHPFVFKALFSNEELTFEDFCETKNVTKGTMYLGFNEEDLVHVGRTGSFVPVIDGADLWRIDEAGKRYAVTGTKGYKWITHAMALSREAEGKLDIDMQYFELLADKAKNAIQQFNQQDFEWFIT